MNSEVYFSAIWEVSPKQADYCEYQRKNDAYNYGSHDRKVEPKIFLLYDDVSRQSSQVKILAEKMPNHSCNN
jgi:hypothetical protein